MKFINEEGIARVRVISPGQGSSAFYKEDQLARDANAFDGGLVFIDHPSRTERKDRPERSLRDLAGSVVGTPIYEKAGAAGPGLYGDVKVAEHWRPFLEDLGTDIGVSIRAGGSVVMESVAGKKTKVAESFNPGATFDFVTQAGRGGKMVAFEAATAVADGKVNEFMEAAGFVESDGRTEEARFMEWLDEPKGEGDKMPDTKLQEQLTESQGKVTTLTQERDTVATERDALLESNTKLVEAHALPIAQDKIVEALADKKHDKLPDVTKKRLIESLTKGAPMKDGKLDEAALATLIEEAVKSEGEYVESITHKKPGISGMGDGEAILEETAAHDKRVVDKAATYFAEGKTKEEATRLAELFWGV